MAPRLPAKYPSCRGTRRDVQGSEETDRQSHSSGRGLVEGKGSGRGTSDVAAHLSSSAAAALAAAFANQQHRLTDSVLLGPIQWVPALLNSVVVGTSEICEHPATHWTSEQAYSIIGQQSCASQDPSKAPAMKRIYEPTPYLHSKESSIWAQPRGQIPVHLEP